MTRPGPADAGRVVGIVLIIVSASSFATVPIWGKLAYGSGIDPLGLLSWRFCLASLVLLGSVGVLRLLGRGPGLPPTRTALLLLALGALLLAPEVLLYFTGLQTVSAGLAETLLFLYPAWVVLISAVAARRPPGKVTVLCVVGAIAGAAITIGAVSGSATLFGAACVVGASILFSVYVAVNGRVVEGVGALSGTGLVMAGAAISFTIAAFATGAHGPHDLPGWGGVAGIVVVGTVVAFGTLSAGLTRVAASTASVISTIEPVVATLVGLVVLSEPVGWAQVGGMVLVVASVAVLLAHEARTGGAAGGQVVGAVAAAGEQ